MMTLVRAPSARCFSTRARRTPGIAATTEACLPTSTVRMAAVTSSPFSRRAALRLQLDIGGARQLFHAVHVGGVRVLAHGPQRHGAVHGAGVDVGEAQPAGQAARNGALAGAGGPVDGDDHTPGLRGHYGLPEGGLWRVHGSRIAGEMPPDEFDKLVEWAYGRIPSRFRQAPAERRDGGGSGAFAGAIGGRRRGTGRHAAGPLSRAPADPAQRLRELRDAGPDHHIPGSARAAGPRGSAT
jgi:hypothetical protein